MIAIMPVPSHGIRDREPTQSRHGSSKLASLLWAVGLIAFLLSVASPFDDALQQDLFRRKSFYVAVRDLPSATAGTRKSGAWMEASVVAVADTSEAPQGLGDVEPDMATVLGNRFFRSSFGLRSPPTVR